MAAAAAGRLVGVVLVAGLAVSLRRGHLAGGGDTGGGGVRQIVVRLAQAGIGRGLRADRAGVLARRQGPAGRVPAQEPPELSPDGLNLLVYETLRLFNAVLLDEGRRNPK